MAIDFTTTSAADAAGHYSTIPDLKLELLGDANYEAHASSPADALAADIAANGENALDQADVRVNLKLGAYSPAPAAFPVTSTAAWVTATIRMAATKYAAGYLINFRDKQAGRHSPAGTGDLSAGDAKIAEGDELLAMLIEAGLPGVTLEDDADDSDFVVDAPISVAATVDADGCDLPTTCDPCRTWVGWNRWR